MYYEIYDEPGFSDAFGRTFQSYIGQVIARANDSGKLKIYPEKEYYVGKERRDSVDWIAEDSTAMLFIESKTKRLRLQAKTALRSKEALEAEIDKLAAFIVQVYKTVRDYRDDRYPQRKHEIGKSVFPLVVTLEDWHAFGDLIQQELESRVALRLEEAGLPREWLVEMPYATCSAEDFEKLVQVIAKHSVFDVMRRRADNPEYKKWEFGGLLSHEFQDAVASGRPLFPEVLEELPK